MNKRTMTFKKLDSKPIPNLKNPSPPFTDKFHVSTWFITLNSNKRSTIEHSTTRLSSDLIYVLKEMFDNQNNLLKFLKFNERELGCQYDLTRTMLDDPVLFPDIPGEMNSNQKLTYVVETGEKYKRVHLHAEYRIIHYSNMTIDLPAFHEVIESIVSTKTNLSFDSVYANVRFIKSALPIYNYMLKGENMKYLNRKKEPDMFEDDYDIAVQQLMNIKL